MNEIIAAKSGEAELNTVIDKLPNGKETGGFGYNKVQDVFNLAYGFSGLVAVAFIIYGAVTYVTSAGNPAEIQKAKNAILWSVVGLVIVLMAAAITWFIIDNINKAG